MAPLRKADPAKIKNQFLAALDDGALRNLQPHLQVVAARLGTTLHMRGEAARYIYFPLSACISIVTTVQEGRGVEVARVGTEGLVGLWAAMGAKSSWHEAVVQVPGDCLRIKTEAFRAEMKGNAALLDHLHRYTCYMIAQISQTAACNRLHWLEQRLARWLLMTRDHVKSDQSVETHEFLSHMLGADRSEVTLAAGILRKPGLISYFRGKVSILDGKRLEALCCDCYQVYADDMQRLLQKKG